MASVIKLPLDCPECGGMTRNGRTYHFVGCPRYPADFNRRHPEMQATYPRPGQLPPAAALVAARYTRTAIALPILWHSITLVRSWRARKRETKLWLALDVVGLTWSLLPVGKAAGHSVLGSFVRMVLR